MSQKIMASLENVGHVLDEDAYVNFNFNQPQYGRYSDGYDILLFPWESTLPDVGWRKHLSLYEELWVPSPWQASVVEGWGFKKPFVYEHGVDPVWEPRYRVPIDKIVFLMQGFEALRKGGRETVFAFNEAFRGVDDVELWIKTKTQNMPKVFPKIKFIEDDLKETELVRLYHDAHVMVAPSYGEGFGVPSRDALATGMPLIHTRGFAPYEDMINENLLIDSDLVESPWPKVHPGHMYQPNVDHLIELMRHTYDNYQALSEEHFLNAPAVHRRYDWDKLTDEAFLALEKRLEYTK